MYKITVAEANSHQQKEAQQGNPWNPIVTLRSWKNIGKKISKIDKELSPGVPPGMQQIERGSNLAQDASKSGFKEALEASWEDQKGAKRDQNRCWDGVFFEVENARI